MQTLDRIARRPAPAVAILYLLLTCWMLWPLPRYAGSAVQDPGDPLFEIWVMRSVQHNLIHQPLRLYDGNAFYPFEYSLAYSEEAISTALVAWPVYLASGNDILAYNAVFIATFWLMAFAVFLLARELGASPGAAFIAGVAAAFAPARYSHLSHLHLLALCWLPLAFWALAAYLTRSSSTRPSGSSPAPLSFRAAARNFLPAGDSRTEERSFAAAQDDKSTGIVSIPHSCHSERAREESPHAGDSRTEERSFAAAQDDKEADHLPTRQTPANQPGRVRQQRYVVLFGVTLAMQLLASLHAAVLSTVALGLFLPFVLWRGRPLARREWVTLGLALVVPYLLLAPTLLPHLWVGELYGFERTRAELQAFASSPGAYLDVFVTNHFWAGRLGTRSEAFFPGAIALAGAALAALACRRWPARWALLLTLVAAIFSFGLSLHIAGRSVPMPWALIYDAFPPIRGIRGVGRFGLLTAIGVPLLAAFGYTAAWRRLAPRLGNRALPVALALTALLTLGATVELRSATRADHIPPDPSFVAWLAEHPAGPVVEFPADGLITHRTSTDDGLFEPIRAMYLSTRTWNPIVAGYSGFIPEPHFALISLLGQHGDEPSAVTARSVGVLQDLGIRWIVIRHKQGYDWQRATALANALPELRLAGQVDGATIYELAHGERAPIALDDAQISMPATIGAGLPFHVSLRIENPNPNPALLRLTPSPDLQIVWRDTAGNIVLRQHSASTLPLAAEPGTSGTLTPVETPAEAGTYTVEAWLDGHPATRREQQVEIFHAEATGEPAAKLVGVRWDPTTVTSGATVAVDVTWRVLRPLGAEYASTVQLIDAGGERKAGYDLLPGGYDPPTSQWQPGQEVTLHYQIAVPPDFPAGSYRLLTALYAWQEGYPRLPIVRPDGTTGAEALIDGFIVR
ncbi:MAG TPA: hypothetical protein PK593_02890 [Thermomicrobiales bacterium]|nr:hypothetical protein [Thermomicrobiales bacterium]